MSPAVWMIGRIRRSAYSRPRRDPVAAPLTCSSSKIEPPGHGLPCSAMGCLAPASFGIQEEPMASPTSRPRPCVGLSPRLADRVPTTTDIPRAPHNLGVSGEGPLGVLHRASRRSIDVTGAAVVNRASGSRP